MPWRLLSESQVVEKLQELKETEFRAVAYYFNSKRNVSSVAAAIYAWFGKL